MIVVVDPGWSTTVQDGGRAGLAHLGVPSSGALDPGRASLVNRAVGNSADAAVLETAGGLVIEAGAPLTIATSGHLGAEQLAPGARLRVDPDPARAWSYLAVRGGIDVEPVLGSRSHDTLSGIGPPPITVGARLPIGDAAVGPVPDVVPDRPRTGSVRVWPGPRADWFAPGALDVLLTSTWRIGPEVSRVGIRLTGPPIDRAVARELPSEGLVLGAVQITPDGRPVVMLADHPTTGGYPVLAVVEPDDVAVVAQARPGTAVRFVAA